MIYFLLSLVAIACIAILIVYWLKMYDDPFEGIAFAFIGFLVFIPFAIWKWIEIFIKAVVWFKSHWK